MGAIILQKYLKTIISNITSKNQHLSTRLGRVMAPCLEVMYKKKINPLIVVLSCQKNKHIWSKIINKNIKNLIIFCGDPNLKSNYLYKNNILYLKCEDTYDHLPTKIYMMINAILDIDDFSSITHIFKLDDHDTVFDNNIIKKIKSLKRENMDYSGQNICDVLDSKWHYNKCPKSSIWHNKPYSGDYVPWADGGCGYLLSRKSMGLIKNNLSKNEIYKKHIYEDMMIALVLHNFNISPKKINNIIRSRDRWHTNTKGEWIAPIT